MIEDAIIRRSASPPGARVPIALYGSERAGMLLPRDAMLYDENGAYVYKQHQLRKRPRKRRATLPVKVTLLMPYGDGWLVQGVDDDDDIVVHGAGRPVVAAGRRRPCRR